MNLLEDMQSRYAAGQALTRDEVGLLLEYVKSDLRLADIPTGMMDAIPDWLEALERCELRLTAPAPDVQPDPHCCRWVKLSAARWQVACNDGEVWWNSTPDYCHRCGKHVMEVFAPDVQPEPQEVCEWRSKGEGCGEGWVTTCSGWHAKDIFSSRLSRNRGVCVRCGKPIREVQA